MVRSAGKDELEILANLAVLMWDSNSINELVNEFSENISKGNVQFFLKYENDVPVGFATKGMPENY